MTAIDGLFEAHLTVRNLERSIEFYRDVIGLRLAYSLPERAVAFFWVGAGKQSMLGLWQVGTAPMSMSLHVAFSVSQDGLLKAPASLLAAGVQPLDFYLNPTSEPVVLAWMPCASVYFRDPDGHLLEYLAMLDEPSEPDRGIVPWSQWRSTNGESAVMPKTSR